LLLTAFDNENMSFLQKALCLNAIQLLERFSGGFHNGKKGHGCLHCFLLSFT